MPEIVDQHVRDQIIQDFYHNILVEAGAGTGKTTLLVERTIYAIVEHGMSLERMALITFMEKAATEIKLRVRRRLEELLASGTLDTVYRKRVQQALHQLPISQVTTIHGFALRFLQSQGHHAPVPLSFRVMDSYQSEQLFQEAFYDWSESDPFRARRLADLFNWGLPFERFMEMAQYLSTQSDIPLYSATKPSTDFMDDVSREVQELEDIARRYASPSDQGLRQIQDIAQFCRNFVRLDPSQRIKALATWQVSAGKGAKKNWQDPDRLTEQKAFIAGLKERLDSFKEQLADYLLSEVRALVVEDFLPFWKDRRWKLGLLTFDDLLWETRDFLRQYGVKDRYDLIMVDEFQDTDALQAEIIVRMLAEEPTSNWLEARIPQGKLFVVGDPKQSIYRFRGADVEIYQRIRQKIEQEGGILLSIVQNFRTPPEILEPVNQLFAANWPPVFDPLRPYVSPYSPLMPFYPSSQETRLIVDGGPTSRGAYTQRALEAHLIARHLRKMVLEDRLWVRDEKEGGRRPIRLGDVALLMPHRTGIHIYQEILRQEGIMVAPEGGIRFFERDEIRGFQQFLSALRNPYEEVYTAGWLLSPWVGMSVQDLAQHKAQGGTLNYLAATVNQGHQVVTTALQMLKIWHQKWWEWRIEDFFWALYEWSALSGVLSERQDVASLSNLAKMADLSRDLGDRWGNDEFCLWLQRKVSHQDKEEEGPLPKAQDAVHIVTVHKSKGLEWPLVVVANWQWDVVAKHPGVRIVSDRMALALGDLHSRWWDELAEEDQHRTRAEQERLYYVALTRARDYLVVIDTFSDEDDGYRAAWSLYQRTRKSEKEV